MMTSPGIFNNGSVFFEWDGTKLNQVPGVPNSAQDSSWYGHMLVLPTGQILFTDYSNDVEIYTSPGSPWPGIAPSALLTQVVYARGSSILLFGNRFNGASQAAAYGDDYQAPPTTPSCALPTKVRGTFSIAAPTGTTPWPSAIPDPPTPTLTFPPTWKPAPALWR